jgi:acetyl-CoA C-acetyltransferase
VTGSGQAYVLATLRTPRGKAKRDGGLATVRPLGLLERLFAGLVERTGLDPARLDDVIIGCATQAGEQGANLARTAVLTVGWPAGVTGMTVNRFCSSGLDAVNLAAAAVRSGAASLVLAGGVESVSRAPMFSDRGPLWTDAEVIRRLGAVHMGIAADLVATVEKFDRDELDAYGLRTQQRAAAAWREGRYARSLLPVYADGALLLDVDEHVRPGITATELAALPPAFAELGRRGQDELVLALRPEIGQVRHLHTQATSPGLADGAAVVLVGDERAAAALGLEPRARIAATATRGSDPLTMLTAGQDAVAAVLGRPGIGPDGVDLVEYAEPFAALCLRIQRDLGFGDDRFNVNGGTIAMGHAFGATGAILLIGLVDELARRGARRGVVAVSGAAGSGVATVLEAP